MKVYVFFIFVAAVFCRQTTEAAAVETVETVHHEEIDVDALVKLLFVNFHRILPCGADQFGIPPLAPYHLDELEFQNLNSFFNISGRVSNLYIYGIDNVEVLELDFNNSTKRFSYDFLLRELLVLAKFNVVGNIFVNNYPIEIPAEGLINKKYSDLRVVGHFDLLPALENPNGLRVDNLKLNFYLGSATSSNVNHAWDNALNNFVNKFLGEGISTAVQQVQKYIDAYLTPILLELGLNKKLENVSERDITAKISDLIVLLQTVDCNAA